MNSITEKIFYINDAKQNQRFIISSMVKNPRTWQVSKHEDMLMGDFGLLRLTFVQVAFNDAVDFVDYNALNPDGTKDVYAMYASYYMSSIEPDEPENIETTSDVRCVLSSSTNVIKVNGSYKTVTANFYDKNNNDVTGTYLSRISIENWSCCIDETNVAIDELLSVLSTGVSNKIKIRFIGSDEYLTKILSVKCEVDDIVGEISLEIVGL